MRVILAGKSALELWDKNLAGRVRPVPISTLDGFQLSLANLRKFEPRAFGVSDPGCLLVPSDSPRANSRKWVSRTWNDPLPPNSIFQATDNLYIASPEVCFKMLATKLGLIDAIKLGMELCGAYSTLVPPGRDYRVRPPLTNAASLKRFIAETSSTAHHSIAARAVRYVADGAESPMETATRIMLCLPHKYGCPGFALPEMNYVIELDEKERDLLEKDTLRPDLLWKAGKVVVEYKGGESHAGIGALRGDSVREAILVSRGYTVIPVVYPSLSTREGFATLTVALSKTLGKRLRGIDDEYYRRQDETRSKVLRGNTCSWVNNA